ncbi:BREX-6 system phosphatase PglZ [Desulfosediminicola sp.]|uniref:BREX-6 system phosphatase PglZ n=1 Tax=Desulfosediminicola sp. TaxID=2886825 RepID=UPI003AF2A531
MGVIAEHIRKKLEQDLRTKGLLVWLDKDHEFSSLVDTWLEQKKEGTFHYDIFAFRGSFLELMVESKDVLSGRGVPKCVIHMPGFNEQDIKETPVLEAYKAGQRWRVSLETMIREVAQGRLSEDQTQFLVSQEGLTLSQAEEFISNEEDIPQEIKGLLRKYGEDGFVLEFIKNPAKINKELCLAPEKCFPLLLEYFDKLVGLDGQWQHDWNQNQIDCSHPDDQADLLVGYLMAMEFVHDLKAEPGSERLGRLKNKQKEYSKKSSTLLHELRESDPIPYVKWAEQVEANLTPEECSQSPKDLGSLDTFRFEADLFLSEAMTLLEKGRWEDAFDLAKVRLPKAKKGSISNTFWLQQDRKRLWLWEWIEVSSQLGIKADQINVEVQKQSADVLSHEDLTGLYVDRWWGLDQIHRRFSSLSERYQSTHSDLHIKAFIEIRKSLHSLYRSCIDEQSLLWNRLCQIQGFLPKEGLQQRNFYSKWVKPTLQKKKKTAIIFVDALRYELGNELVEELQSICGKQDISPMLAELPTITAVGMNALVPVVNGAKVAPLFDKKGVITGFQGGQRQVKTPDERQKTLQEHAGVETSWIVLHDLLLFSDRKLKNIVDKELLVVTALDIDKMGESGALAFGIDYFEKGLARLKTAVIKLKEKGYEQFVITADHGFILGDESLETGKAPKLECAERRYAYGSERNSENLISASLNQLNYSHSGADDWFIFERSTHLITNQSRTSFYHGGNTLQERVVPVISFSLGKDLPGSSGTFELSIQKKSDVLGFHRIAIYPTSKDSGLFSLPQVEVQLVSDEGVLVEIGDIVGAQRQGDILTLPLSKESEVYFKLCNGPCSKAKIYFKTTRRKTVLENSEYPEYFEVENYSLSTDDKKPEKKTKKVKSVSTSYSDAIPEEYHTALAHLEKHGSLTEKFLVNTLGSGSSAARKGRRFANKIAEWLKDLPFDVYIEQTAEGKEYRKK